MMTLGWKLCLVDKGQMPVSGGQGLSHQVLTLSFASSLSFYSANQTGTIALSVQGQKEPMHL
jgi:hypothetical protein